MRFFKFSLIFILALVFLAATQIVVVPRYDLSIERTTLADPNLSHSGGVYTLHTLQPKNIWYIGVKKNALDSQGNEDFCVNWQGNGTFSQECLDHDGRDETDEYYTFPASIGVSAEVTFSLPTEGNITPENITVYSMNTARAGNRLAWRWEETQASPTIISRAQW